MYKILIIEDDKILSDIYQTKIRAEGYMVETAPDGESGFLKVISFRPDLVLLDINLPDLLGTDLIKLLREMDDFKDLSIVVFTGTDSEEVIKNAEALGANKAFSKTKLTPDQLVATITTMVAGIPKKEKTHLFYTLAEWEEPVWKKPMGRVLIVEDDPIIRRLVIGIVEEAGYTTVKAQDGREAYKILEKDSDFVGGIFDIKMPFIEGPDLIKHMMTRKGLMKIPVLIITSDESQKAHSDSLSAGERLFLQKPFTRVKLKSILNTLFAKRLN